MIYRTNAKLLSKLESLELVKKAAIEFLKALDSDAGYPMRRQESLVLCVGNIVKKIV